MPEDNGFAFQQEIARPPPMAAPPAASERAATPQQSVARDIDTRDDGLPSWESQPVQRFSLLLRNVAAGMRGQELPSDQLRAQRRRQDELEMQAVNTTVNALAAHVPLVRRARPEDRAEFIRTLSGRMERITPGYARMLERAANDAGTDAVVDLLIGNPRLQAVARAMGAEFTTRLMSDSTFMTGEQARLEAEHGPEIAARIRERQAIAREAEARGMAPPGTGAQVGPANLRAEYARAMSGRESPTDRDDARPIDPASGQRMSSAMGPGQFTDSTWAGTRERPNSGIAITHARELGIDPELAQRAASGDAQARQSILTLRSNRPLALRAIELLAEENAPVLERAGLAADPGNLAVAHQFGAGGAVELLRARSDQPVNEVVSERAYAANRSQLTRNGQPRTAGEVRDEIRADIMRRMEGTVPRGRGNTFADLLALEPTVPERLRFTPAQLGVIRRNPAWQLQMNIIPDALLVREAQARSDQATAAPHFERVTEGANQFLAAVDPNTGRERWRMPIGQERFNDREFRTALALRIAGQELGPEISAATRSTIGRLTPDQAQDLQDSLSTGGVTYSDGRGGTLQVGSGGGSRAALQRGMTTVQEAGISTDQLVSRIDRMQEQLNSGEVRVGATGWVQQFLSGIGAQGQEAMAALRQAGMGDQAARIGALAQSYDFSRFGQGAAASQQFRTNVIDLAFLMARQANMATTGGGRGAVSDTDVRFQLDKIATGGAAVNPQHIAAALQEIRGNAVRDYHILRDNTPGGARVPLSPRLALPAAGAAPPQAPGGSATPPTRYRMDPNSGRLVPVQ